MSSIDQISIAKKKKLSWKIFQKPSVIIILVLSIIAVKGSFCIRKAYLEEKEVVQAYYQNSAYSTHSLNTNVVLSNGSYDISANFPTGKVTCLGVLRIVGREIQKPFNIFFLFIAGMVIMVTVLSSKKITK